MPIVAIEELDRQALAKDSQVAIEAEKQCRISLAADFPRPIKLEWNAGGRNGRLTVITLEPGKSVVQPLSKAQAWLGPFAVPLEYAATSDERRKEKLRQFWAQEKERALNRYDYERPISVAKGGYEPIGPHRFPDVEVTIIESDGSEHEPVRLHELYKIGDFDPLKDSFGPKESIDEVRARYEGELEETRERYERDLESMRRQLAEVAGMVKGLAAAGSAQNG